MSEQLDLMFARARGHARAKDAADHADRRRHRWTDTAVAFVGLYIAKRCPAGFLAEDVRRAAEAWGLADPPDGRAWGHVMKRAEREGLIVADGYGSAASSNGSPKVRWRKA